MRKKRTAASPKPMASPILVISDAGHQNAVRVIRRHSSATSTPAETSTASPSIGVIKWHGSAKNLRTEFATDDWYGVAPNRGEHTVTEVVDLTLPENTPASNPTVDGGVADIEGAVPGTQQQPQTDNEALDEFDAMGINVAAKLRRMEPTQRIHAEWLINKIMSLGLMNYLSPNIDVTHL